MTDEHKERNQQNPKVCSRVEHVFGFMEQTMGGLIFKGVGRIKAKANTALTNLVYDMCRLVQIKKCQPNLIMIQRAEYQTTTQHLPQNYGKKFIVK